MNFNYSEKISEMTAEQKLRFYESLAHNLTVSMRMIWSNCELSAEEKVDQMKWVNEIMHRITAKISVTRLKSHEWAESDIYEMMNGFVSQTTGIKAIVASAILHSYNDAANQK